jgi:hypothetical protein
LLGALFLFQIVRWRILFGLPVLLIAVWKQGWGVLLSVGWALVVATLAGAAGGAGFSVLQPLRARSLRIWAISAGYVSVALYLAVAIVGLGVLEPFLSLRTQPGLVAYGIGVGVFGAVMAGVYYDFAKPPAGLRAGRRRRATKAAA